MPLSPQLHDRRRSRRDCLQIGCLGIAGLSLADVLRLRAAADSQAHKHALVILFWLEGGPSQLETYDPKPLAPAEYRGPFGAISTNVSGVQFGELLPEQARLMDRIAIVRTVQHDNGDHYAAAQWMLTGYFGANPPTDQRYPAAG